MRSRSSLLLILAVAFLCWSFAKQMRKVKAADEAGVYDEPEETGRGATTVSEREPGAVGQLSEGSRRPSRAQTTSATTERRR